MSKSKLIKHEFEMVVEPVKSKWKSGYPKHILSYIAKSHFTWAAVCCCCLFAVSMKTHLVATVVASTKSPMGQVGCIHVL